MKAIVGNILAILIFVSITAANGFSEEYVGIVKSLDGEVTIVRNDTNLKAEENFRLLVNDVVQTGAKGKVGLILEDDTVISMGFDSKIAIKDFIFQPNEKRLSLIAKIFHGTVSFLSGQLSKLSPEQVRIETPYATVASRGTHILIQVE